MTTHVDEITLRPLTDADRQAIEQWHYDGALQIYDPGPGALTLRAPDHLAFAAADGALLGYGTLGPDARVRGGLYDDETPTTDLGMGLSPELVGRGHGTVALRRLIAEAIRRVPNTRLRVTVATSNPRASALVLSAGFTATHEFVRAHDGRAFTQYERDGPDSAPK